METIKSKYADKAKEFQAVQYKAKEAIIEFLREFGPQEYDWEYSCAPSIASVLFSDDLADTYIKAIWLDGDTIKINEHAYYLGEDLDDVCLDDEIVDYIALFSDIVAYFGE